MNYNLGRKCNLSKCKAPGRACGPHPYKRHDLRGRAADEGGRSDKALSTLDSLLGTDSEVQGSPGSDPNLVEWWRIRPRQSAPPRTTSISASRNPSGRFIANEEMLRNEVWAGRKTLPGQALQLPKVTPYVSYVLALVNAAVYGTAVRVNLMQGADAAAELLSGIGLDQDAVLEQGQVWRLLSGAFVHSDLLPLAVVLYGTLVVAPRVEASLGYRTFTAAYLFSALVAADALLALAPGASTTDPALSAAVAAPMSDTLSTLAASSATSSLSEASSASLSNSAADVVAAASVSAPDAVLEAMVHPAGQAAALALAGPSGTGGGAGMWLGGLGAVMGVAGCATAHALMNGGVERLASSVGASSSGRREGTGGEGSSRGSEAVVDAAIVVLIAGAAAVGVQHLAEPGGMALVAALAIGFATGFLLASTAGPRYQVTREVELPDGSMWIPDPDAVEEVTVVLDQTTSIQRTLATSILALAVLASSTAVLTTGSAL